MAIADEVFACENAGIRLISGLGFDVPDGLTTPASGDSDECEVVSFTLSLDYASILPVNLAETLAAGGVYPLTIIGNELPESAAESMTTLFEEVRDKYRNCREIAEGMSMCTPCAEGDCDVSTAAFYVRGRDWAASCGQESASGGRFCQTSYMIAPGLGVTYRFGRNGVDPDKLSTLDIAVREAVATLQQPEFDRPPDDPAYGKRGGSLPRASERKR